MPELSSTDVELYTKGRLLASDPETARILARALATARRYCEWHVTPVRTNQTVSLDGPGGRVLMLPTLKLVRLNTVTEDGVALNIADLVASAGGPVRLRKKKAPHSARTAWWSCEYNGIVVNMDHGYVEADAEDWRAAVLDACDRFSLEVGRGDLQRYTVDDVVRMWFERKDVFSTRLLDPYRLLAPA